MLELLKTIRVFFDITHPVELFHFGVFTFEIFFILIILLGFFGIILALINLSFSRNNDDSQNITKKWLNHYGKLVYSFQHATLIILILTLGFFVCSTLANRYKNWEENKISKVANTISGEKLEQPSPQVKYKVKKINKTQVFYKGEYITKENERNVDYYLNLSGSKINVEIDQIEEKSKSYKINFQADYEVTNTLGYDKEFIFEAYQPYNYKIIQDFRVEKNGLKLEPINPNGYSFNFNLNKGEKTHFIFKYKSEGAPRWVYEAYNQLLSNFLLTVKANFTNAEFASGVRPTTKKREGESTVFTWDFKDNVAVKNPFGIYTVNEYVTNTGVLPRLLFISPAILLWWLLLLYLSNPLKIKQLIIFCAIFFASLLALTYFSRVMETMYAWLIISICLLGMIFIIKSTSKEKINFLVCAIVGLIIPLFAFIIPNTGLTLSISALLSTFWLAFLSRDTDKIES